MRETQVFHHGKVITIRSVITMKWGECHAPRWLKRGGIEAPHDQPLRPAFSKFQRDVAPEDGRGV